VSASRAGSRRDAPGWCWRVRWRAWSPPSPEGLDDDHAPAAAGTGRDPIEWFRRLVRFWRRRYGKQFTGTRHTGPTCGTGEPAVMADVWARPLAGFGAAPQPYFAATVNGSGVGYNLSAAPIPRSGFVLGSTPAVRTAPAPHWTNASGTQCGESWREAPACRNWRGG
jgi:hypothetical protein